jgi:caa(3)-type oxidase subunit IV
MAHATHHPVDPTDPHGFQSGHHGHVIIPVRTLVGVLLILLFFTGLTVAASRTEIWAAQAFHVDIPQWVNIVVALSIAVIKSALVAMFFMQLRYDNPLHALVFLFCLFAFALFLFFCMTDLGTRAAVYPYKAGEVLRGGTGNVTWGRRVQDPETGQWRVVTVQGPIVEFSREQFNKEVGPERFAAVREDAKSHGGHAGVEPEAPPSTASRSRPLRGLTGALEARSESGAGTGGGGHGGH